jgi:hypothetical protein
MKYGVEMNRGSLRSFEATTFPAKSPLDNRIRFQVNLLQPSSCGAARFNLRNREKLWQIDFLPVFQAKTVVEVDTQLHRRFSYHMNFTIRLNVLRTSRRTHNRAQNKYNYDSSNERRDEGKPANDRTPFTQNQSAKPSPHKSGNDIADNAARYVTSCNHTAQPANDPAYD